MSNLLLHLWQDMPHGDQNAWRQLVRQLTPLVFSVARRSGLQESDAADITQQTWVALYRQRHQVREPAKLTSWLTMVTKRKAQRRIAQQNRTRELARHLPDRETVSTPEDEFSRLERVALLKLAIEQLDVRCRTLLELVFFAEDELSYADLAARLHISVNSVGPIRLRCLKRLRKILEEFELD